jgi:hypothetical protein
VGLVADADAVGEQRFGVEAGGEVEIGDGRTIAADQGENPGRDILKGLLLVRHGH